jgi:hypothetical protein
MSESVSIQVYRVQDDAYRQAFQLFLQHTDQKRQTRDWLLGQLRHLTHRRVFIDAGAGSGQVMAWLADQFQRTIAIEPNPFFHPLLKHAWGSAEVLGAKIADVAPPAADLILCLHVFYYLDPADWRNQLARLASWLAPDGLLVLALQNTESDGMRMLRHFGGARFDLAQLARDFGDQCRDQFDVVLETMPARVACPDFATVYRIAEFMLNGLPLPATPRRQELEDYVREHFAVSGGGYGYSCAQDLLQVRRLPGGAP